MTDKLKEKLSSQITIFDGAMGTEIYKKNFGKEISQEDALDKAIKLARLFEIIYQPMTQEELDNVLNRKKELNL